MLEKWLKLFLGEKVFSSMSGVIMAGAAGILGAVASGRTSKTDLIISAAAGIAGGFAGAGGRATGENKGESK